MNDRLEEAFSELLRDLLREAKAVGKSEDLKALAEVIAADLASSIKMGFSGIHAELKNQILLLFEMYRIRIVKAEQQAMLKFLGKAVQFAAHLL